MYDGRPDIMYNTRGRRTGLGSLDLHLLPEMGGGHRATRKEGSEAHERGRGNGRLDGRLSFDFLIISVQDEITGAPGALNSKVD